MHPQYGPLTRVIGQLLERHPGKVERLRADRKRFASFWPQRKSNVVVEMGGI